MKPSDAKPLVVKPFKTMRGPQISKPAAVLREKIIKEISIILMPEEVFNRGSRFTQEADLGMDTLLPGAMQCPTT